MSDVFLLRHGETEWNTAGRFQGQRDSPLTARGREQAAQLGGILHRSFAAGRMPILHVSPLGRTRETAAIFCWCMGDLTQVTVDSRLQEVSAGSWDGLTQEDIEAGWPGALDGSNPYDWYFRAPDGETLDAACRRVRSWLAELDELDGPVVAVSHGLLGRLVRGAWLGLSVPEMLSLPAPQDLVWHLSATGICPLVAG
jgi:broad specificity phosphatase PhoE